MSHLALGTMVTVPYSANYWHCSARPSYHRLTVWTTLMDMPCRICSSTKLPSGHTCSCGYASRTCTYFRSTTIFVQQVWQQLPLMKFQCSALTLCVRPPALHSFSASSHSSARLLAMNKAVMRLQQKPSIWRFINSHKHSYMFLNLTVNGEESEKDLCCQSPLVPFRQEAIKLGLQQWKFMSFLHMKMIEMCRLWR